MQLYHKHLRHDVQTTWCIWRKPRWHNCSWCTSAWWMWLWSRWRKLSWRELSWGTWPLRHGTLGQFVMMRLSQISCHLDHHFYHSRMTWTWQQRELASSPNIPRFLEKSHTGLSIRVCMLLLRGSQTDPNWAWRESSFICPQLTKLYHPNASSLSTPKGLASLRFLLITKSVS